MKHLAHALIVGLALWASGFWIGKQLPHSFVAMLVGALAGAQLGKIAARLDIAEERRRNWR